MSAFDVDPIPKQMTQGFTFTVQYNEYKSLIFMDQVGVGQC